MTRRSIIALFVLSIVTLGIYSIVWFVSTKREMVARGADIPTAWLVIVPFVGIWWTWKWCEGVERVTDGKTSQVMAFVLIVLLGVIGMAIIQNSFNKDSGVLAVMPQARLA